MLVAATLRTGEQHEDEALLAELAERPDHRARCTRGRWAPEATPSLVRRRLGERRPRRRSSPPATARPGGNPLLLRQLLRALQVEGVRPDAVARRHGQRDRLARRVEHGAHAARPAARASAPRSPARSPCSATARRCRRSRRWPGSTSTTTARRDRRAGPGRGAARPSHPLGFVHPLVGDAVYRALPAASGSCARAGRRRAAAAGRSARAGGRAPHARAAPRRRADAVAVLRAAAATAADRGAADARPPTCERALAEPPDRRRAARRAARARPARDADRRAGRGRATCGRPTTRSPTRELRAEVAHHARPHAGVRRPARARRPRSPGGRGRGCPPDLDDAAAGPARAGADRRLHARARPAVAASAGRRRSAARASAPGCSPPPSPGRS